MRGAVANEPVSGRGIADGSAWGEPGTVVEQAVSSTATPIAAPIAVQDFFSMDSSSRVDPVNHD
ncbi:hypothetical protein MTP03_41780 [Tsukamurella sp. PLM1]|nr:hypothetical protein MTP03_41780 [Tsukamurella sp. PLM1]